MAHLEKKEQLSNKGEKPRLLGEKSSQNLENCIITRKQADTDMRMEVDAKSGQANKG